MTITERGDYVIKVIRSCENVDQLIVAGKWALKQMDRMNPCTESLAAIGNIRVTMILSQFRLTCDQSFLLR